MISPSLSQIDEVRKSGFRPQVVGCFVQRKKVFVFFDEKYGIWQFPQGGIENRETIEQALKREMTEELGKNFVKLSLMSSCKFLGNNSVKFPPDIQGSRELQTDRRENIKMKGKWYYIVAIQTTEKSFQDSIDESEFDDWKLLSYAEAIDLSEEIYQMGKKRITILILDLLKKNGLID